MRYAKYVIVLLVLAGIAASMLVGLLLYRKAQTVRWRNQATEAFEQGALRDAIRYFGFYLSRIPDDLDALEQYASANLQMVPGRMGALQDAATAYHQILRYKPEHREAEDRLLDVYKRMRNWPTLEYYAREFLTHRANDPVLLRMLADSLKAMGRHTEALEVYRTLVDLGKADPEVYENLVTILRAQNQLPAARALLESAVAGSPLDAGLKALHARFLFDTGESGTGENALEKAAELSPNDYRVLRVKAERAARNRDWGAAREFLQQALHDHSEDPDLLLFTARVDVRLGQVERAVDLLAAVPKIVLADNPELWITLGDLQISAGRPADAEKTIADFLDSHPEQKPIADYLKGRLLLAASDPVAATELFATAARQRPNFLPAQFYLALSYFASGKEGLGRSTLEAYINRNPDDERARMLLSWGKPGGTSLDDLVLQARDMLARGPDVPEMYLQTAALLFRVAKSQNAVADHLDTVVALFDRVLRMRPESEIAYQGLIETLALAGKTEESRNVLQRAEKAGINPMVLLRCRAYVALSESNVAAAETCFAELLATPEVRSDDIAGWSDMFARWGHADRVVDLLTKAISSVDAPQRVPLQIQRVAACLRANRVEDALGWLNEINVGSGDDPSLLQSLNRVRSDAAVLALEVDAPAFASSCERLVLDIRDLNPKDIHADLIAAHLLLKGADPDLGEARRLLRGVLLQEPSSFGARLGLAEYLRQTGDFTGALYHLSLIENEIPEAINRFRVRLANRLMDFGWTREAVGLVAFAQDAPDSAFDGKVAYVRAAALTGGLASANEVLAQLKSMENLSERQQKELVAVDVLLAAAGGRRQEAEEGLRRWFSADDATTPLSPILVDALLLLDKGDEAETRIRESAQKGGDALNAQMALATVQYRRASRESLSRGVATLSAILFDRPSYLPALRLLAEILLMRGDVGRSVAVADRILALDEDDAAAWYAKSRGLAEMPGQGGSALAAVSRAIELVPVPEYFYFRGILLLNDRKYNEARPDLELAAKASARTSADLDLRLARVYLASGEMDLARAFWDSALTKAAESGVSLDPKLRRELEQELSGVRGSQPSRRQP